MCSSPPTVSHAGVSYQVRCGQCMECRLAYSREWAIRMTHEQQCHAQSCFLTLTYDDQNLPAFGQLEKRALQLFFKRLRKAIGPFRYVACGEYGELRRRPHFHVALFGNDFRDDRVEFGIHKGERLFISPTLARSWPFGHHAIGSLTFESAAYIARYITKRISGPGASARPLGVDPDSGELVMPNPEFLLCSKGRVRGQGIGGAWFDQFFATDVFPHGRVITSQGTPAPVPAYYKRKLSANRALALQLSQRIAENKPVVPFWESENRPERRAARTVYAKARTGVFQRDIG